MQNKNTQHYIYGAKFKVRDYECDLQGVVNNANYQHYMEHTRHEFLNVLGEDFARMHQQGIDAFVRRVEIEYLRPLKSGDTFISLLHLHKAGAKAVFIQHIYLDDGTPVVKGTIEAVAVVDGKLSKGAFFDALIEKAIQKMPPQNLDYFVNHFISFHPNAL